MKTLLLQNQQIIIQQQNMMFMVIKQFQSSSSSGDNNNNPNNRNHQPQQHSSIPTISSEIQHNNNISHQRAQHSQHPETAHKGCQLEHHQQSSQQDQQSQSQLQSIRSSVDGDEAQQHHQQLHNTAQSQQIYNQTMALTPLSTPSSHPTTITSTINNIDIHHQLQQVSSQLQDNLGSFLTPAQSEQDPVGDSKAEDDDLVALLENDALLSNNVLYNPQTDIGSITPYKNHAQQQQTPSYYSSGCESLTTPRVEQQRHQSTSSSTTNNISQNVVKNLADSFKSPSKPKINVQILSGSASRNMKNSKAKIIQSMNISEFLRHVHPSEDRQKASH